VSGCEWREVETRKNVEKRLEEWKTGEEERRLEKFAETFVYCEGAMKGFICLGLWYLYDYNLKKIIL